MRYTIDVIAVENHGPAGGDIGDAAKIALVHGFKHLWFNERLYYLSGGQVTDTGITMDAVHRLINYAD